MQPRLAGRADAAYQRQTVSPLRAAIGDGACRGSFSAGGCLGRAGFSGGFSGHRIPRLVMRLFGDAENCRLSAAAPRLTRRRRVSAMGWLVPAWRHWRWGLPWQFLWRWL